MQTSTVSAPDHVSSHFNKSRMDLKRLNEAQTPMESTRWPASSNPTSTVHGAPRTKPLFNNELKWATHKNSASLGARCGWNSESLADACIVTGHSLPIEGVQRSWPLFGETGAIPNRDTHRSNNGLMAFFKAVWRETLARFLSPI